MIDARHATFGILGIVALSAFAGLVMLYSSSDGVTGAVINPGENTGTLDYLGLGTSTPPTGGTRLRVEGGAGVAGQISAYGLSLTSGPAGEGSASVNDLRVYRNTDLRGNLAINGTTLAHSITADGMVIVNGGLVVQTPSGRYSLSTLNPPCVGKWTPIQNHKRQILGYFWACAEPGQETKPIILRLIS